MPKWVTFCLGVANRCTVNELRQGDSPPNQGPMIASCRTGKMHTIAKQDATPVRRACGVGRGDFPPGPNPKPDVQVSKHPAFQMILVLQRRVTSTYSE